MDASSRTRKPLDVPPRWHQQSHPFFATTSKCLNTSASQICSDCASTASGSKGFSTNDSVEYFDQDPSYLVP